MSVKYVASSPFVVVCWCYVSHSVAFTANYICHFEFAFIHTHTHFFFVVVFFFFFLCLFADSVDYCLLDLPIAFAVFTQCVCVYVVLIFFLLLLSSFVKWIHHPCGRRKKKLIRLLHCQLIFRLVRPHCSSTMDILFRSFVQSVQFLINMQSIM